MVSEATATCWSIICEPGNRTNHVVTERGYYFLSEKGVDLIHRTLCGYESPPFPLVPEWHPVIPVARCGACERHIKNGTSFDQWMEENERRLNGNPEEDMTWAVLLDVAGEPRH